MNGEYSQIRGLNERKHGRTPTQSFRKQAKLITKEVATRYMEKEAIIADLQEKLQDNPEVYQQIALEEQNV